jgi:hypothetical protein
VYSLTQCTTVPSTGEKFETRRTIPGREYSLLWHQRDLTRYSIIKKRRCFLYGVNYFQLDYYQDPNPGLVLLEAYFKKSSSISVPPSPKRNGSSTSSVSLSSSSEHLPPFLWIVKEVTGDPSYSMFQLAKVPEPNSLQ